MFCRKTLLLIFIGTLVPVFIPVSVEAYGIGTHAYLTNEAFDFFNTHFDSRTISPELRDFLVDGARREDDVPRWMNHFYDPVNERGLTYDASIDPVSVGNWESSKEWANDQESQNGAMYKVPTTIASILNAIQKKKLSLVSDETDFTWQEAIRAYANGENEKAMFSLGHVLHLIQDASVPDHTRNDPHADGSPYENFSGAFTLTSIDGDLGARLKKKTPVILTDIYSYFKDLATYSNNNFYSKDTIGIQSGYKLPEIDTFEILLDGKEYGMKEDKEFGSYPLLRAKRLLSLKNEEMLNRPLIMSSYWSRLSTKAVQYSAGVINLFFEEAEKAKNDPTFVKTKEKSFIAVVVEGIGKAVSTIGETANKAREFISDFVGGRDEALQETGGDEEYFDSEDYTPAEESFFDENPPVLEQVEKHESEKNEEERNTSLLKTPTTIPSVTSTQEKKVQEKQNEESEKSEEEKETSSPHPSQNITSAPSPTPQFYSLKINEVMYDAEGSDDGNEWIEIKNTSTSTVDISDWRFFENNTNHRLELKSGQKNISSGGFVVIADNAEKFLASYPSFSQTLFDSSFSLSNGGELIALKNGDLEIDSVLYNPSIGAKGDGKTLQRSENGTWYSSSPTPGSENRAESKNSSPTASFSFLPISPKAGEVVAFDASSSEDLDGTLVSYEWDFGDGEISSSTLNSTNYTYDNLGDFSVKLSVTDNDGAISSTTRVVSVVSRDERVSPADHIVISEVLFDAMGSDEGKEFIELHNPTDSPLDLHEWSLRYTVGDSTSSVSIASFNADSGDITSISPHGFFLVGLNSYASSSFNGRDADVVRSRSLPNGSDKISIILFNTEKDTIDEISYKSESIEEEGNSIERKVVSGNVCVIAQDAGEFLGNACDRDGDNDFNSRPSPNPQNSRSLKEPRVPFSPVMPKEGATSTIIFQKNALRLDFEWAESTSSDDLGISKYRIVDVSSSTEKLSNRETNTTTTAISIQKIGREYIFEITAYDKDGYGSDPRTYSVFVESFIDSMYVYADPREGLQGRYVLDLYYSQFPFIPNVFGKNAWQAMVFYVNRAPNENNVVLTNSNAAPHPPQDLSSVFSIVYPSCSGGGEDTSVNSIPFPLASEWCASVGGGLHTSALSYGSLEDKHLLIRSGSSVSDMNLSANDYITIGYYDLSDTGGGRQDFTLVASDQTKYYFRDTKPDQRAPELLGDITKTFNEESSLLTLSWNGATDADTLDSRIVYDLDFATSTEATTTWAITVSSPRYEKQVASGDRFIISLRARDDFSNVSAVTTTTWNYPDVEWHILQERVDGWSSEFGTVSQNSMEPDTAVFQSIIPQKDISVNKIAVRLTQEVVSDYANVRIGIYPDTGSSTPNMSVVLGEAIIPNLIRPDPNTDQTFTFSSPVALSAETMYWLVVDVASHTDSRGYFRNIWRLGIAGGDVYAFGDAGSGRARGQNADLGGGLSSINPGSDWYMKIGLK